MRKHKISRSVSVDLSKFANIDTGEMLESEALLCAGAKLVKPTDLIRISYDHYFVLNDRFSLDIKLSIADRVRFLSLGFDLRTEWNICFNGSIPHTRASMAKEFDVSVREVSRFITRMRSLGLIRYDWVKGLGYSRRVYLINPYVMRSRKTFHKDLLIFFKDLGV